MKNRFYLLTFLLITLFTVDGYTAERKKYNFNSEWRLQVGDFPQAKKPDFRDSDWKQVTLPRAFNEDEAFQTIYRTAYRHGCLVSQAFPGKRIER